MLEKICNFAKSSLYESTGEDKRRNNGFDQIRNLPNKKTKTLYIKLICINMLKMNAKKKKILSMYKDRRISLAKAAEMLDASLWDMPDLIEEEGIYLDYSEEELREDIKGWAKGD